MSKPVLCGLISILVVSGFTLVERWPHQAELAGAWAREQAPEGPRPGEGPHAHQTEVPADIETVEKNSYEAEVLSVAPDSCPAGNPGAECRLALVRLREGPEATHMARIFFDVAPGEAEAELSKGDDVLLVGEERTYLLVGIAQGGGPLWLLVGAGLAALGSLLLIARELFRARRAGSSDA